MVGLSAARVRALVTDHVVLPERDGIHLAFSFQDLVLLRAAKALFDSKVPSKRVYKALRKLAQDLPTGRPLTALTLRTEGDRVIVSDGGKKWQADTGQTLFDFTTKFDISVKELAEKAAPLTLLATKRAHQRAHELSADDWYDLGCALELSDIDQARDAYRRAIELHTHHGDAHLNLGRLLHEAGQLDAAVAHYRLALEGEVDRVLAQFNLGVALTDKGALEEAQVAYEGVLALDDAHADTHYNLAAVCERLGKRNLALQHLQRYKKLIAG